MVGGGPLRAGLLAKKQEGQGRDPCLGTLSPGLPTRQPPGPRFSVSSVRRGQITPTLPTCRPAYGNRDKASFVTISSL